LAELRGLHDCAQQQRVCRCHPARRIVTARGLLQAQRLTAQQPPIAHVHQLHPKRQAHLARPGRKVLLDLQQLGEQAVIGPHAAAFGQHPGTTGRQAVHQRLAEQTRRAVDPALARVVTQFIRRLPVSHRGRRVARRRAGRHHLQRPIQRHRQRDARLRRQRQGVGDVSRRW